MTASPVFSILLHLFGDQRMIGVFDEQHTIRLWVRVERELALEQAAAGVLSHEAAAAVDAAGADLTVDTASLWAQARTIGYPILPLVRQLDAAVSAAGVGCVHRGATTQDIMDTALAMQLSHATDLMLERVGVLGDSLVELMQRHRGTVMAGRTHAQQAVPITFGSKLAGFVAQLARVHARLVEERPRVCAISLHGAAGTSAALGPQAAVIRDALARRLGLEPGPVAWHVARDALAAQGANAVGAAEIGARLAREVVDLSRTEVGEVFERPGHHRGASSTMPQKANPVLSEAVVGLAVAASSLQPALFRGVEAGHERAAGEWQAEWFAVPNLFVLASSALAVAAEMVAGLEVDDVRMAANLTLDHGLLMSEAYMIALSDHVGRERAHDLVYEAARVTRSEGTDLETALKAALPPDIRDVVSHIDPLDYLGDVDLACDGAAEAWRTRGGGHVRAAP